MTETENKGICYTAESNARFAALPPNKQRVVIALDGLQQLAARKLVGKVGQYVRQLKNNQLSDSLWRAADTSRSFQDTIGRVDMEGCEVCAKGLIFLCTIARRNQVTNIQAREFIAGYASTWMGDKMARVMGGVFSAEQLRLMEVEFEGSDVEYKVLANKSWQPNTNRIQPRMELTLLARGGERLTAILRNIIDNDGEFKPVPPDAETVAFYQAGKLPPWKKPSKRRESVTVTVTADQIAKGDPSDPKRHPVALALHKAGLRRWDVGGDEFIVGKWDRQNRRPFPQSVVAFVNLYDNDELRHLAQPFSFEVAI